jgi:hypothetical protein
MVATQIILLSWWFSKKNPVKMTNQKDPIKMVGSKLICPKRHFGQIGHGGKKTIWGVFFCLEFPFKKVGISCSEGPNMVIEKSIVIWLSQWEHYISKNSF